MRSVQPFTITFNINTYNNEPNTLSIRHNNNYAGGGRNGIGNPEQLRKEINLLCGEGSYLLYDKDSFEILKEEKSPLAKRGRLTYVQQGFKTDVIEVAREYAIEAWGRLPELQCPAWENSFLDVE